MPKAEETFLRPATVAPMLGVGVGRIYQLVASGELPTIRRGRSILIPRAAWNAWLEKQSDKALASLAPQGGEPS